MALKPKRSDSSDSMKSDSQGAVKRSSSKGASKRSDSVKRFGSAKKPQISATPTRRITRSASIEMEQEKMKTKDPLDDISWLQWITVYSCIVTYPIYFLWAGGAWHWPQAWLWTGWHTSFSLITLWYLYIYDHALLASRFKHRSPGQSGWDRVAFVGISISCVVNFLGLPVEAKLFRWSDSILPEFLQPGRFPRLFFEGIGLALVLGSSFFLFRAFYDNTFLSPVVEVQKERKHKVIQEGAYAIVRHPMYTGATMMFIGQALLLGSVPALVLAFLIATALSCRAVGEEKLLTQELDGYEQYMKKVPYRLIPKVF